MKIAGNGKATHSTRLNMKIAGASPSEHAVPLKTVMQEAIRRYLDQKNG